MFDIAFLARIILPCAKPTAAADLAQHDPLLAHFMVGQEAAGEEGVAAVVDGQVGQGRAAAARDEEDQAGPVALGGLGDMCGGIVRALEPQRPAQELDHRVQRAGHPHAVDGTAHRPVGPLQHPLDADHDIDGTGGMGLVDEQGLAGEVCWQVVGREAIQGGMGAGKGVVERAGLAQDIG